MSEGMPNGQQDNVELNRLIHELELQIEGVNAGLEKLRSTVARLSYAALGSATPSAQPGWTPAGPTSVEAGAEQAGDDQVAGAQGLSAADSTPAAHSLNGATGEAAPGAWDSVAEGASWPRAHAEEPAQAAPPDFSDWTWELPGFQKEESPEAQDHAQAGADATNPAREPEQAGSTGDTPSTGWPNESGWMQGFHWPGDHSTEPAQDAEPAGDAGHIDISDIVAQVKAEIEAARRGEGPMPWLDFEEESRLDEGETSTETQPPQAHEEAEAGSSPASDDGQADERRDEVSRVVAEMKAQLEAGAFEEVMQGKGQPPAESFGHEPRPVSLESDGSGDEAHKPAEEEDEVRAEVRRAVEATRDELSGESGRPAFRLAAPGAFPDWSHMQEPSGPPVLVLKDAAGRVELARVYEALNELGWGDGAALLNYTPHSVTVGLPLTASFPSKERMAAAVQKVFGQTSRVESDGVRITVSIGEDPKVRSDAA